MGQVSLGSAEIVDQAVRSARAAFESGEWSKRTPAGRKEAMFAWIALLEAHAEELAALDCVDAGKPITECRENDIPAALETLRWHAEAADKVFGKVAPTGPEALGVITKGPIGVVGAVLPWNYPAAIFAFKVGPALAAGNSVIVKPAELTSMSAYLMVKLAHEAGIPESALLLVTGRGEDTGKPLGLHTDVDVVSFTGSTAVGRKFLEYSAQSNLKEVVLELGGKSPQIVFGDYYNLDEVVDNVLESAFLTMGQNCTAGSRLLVEASVKDELLDALMTQLRQWKIGDPADSQTQIGPMIEQAHFEKVLSYIHGASDEGATLIYREADENTFPDSWLVGPTIYADVTPQMSLFQNEVFGPVLAVTTFESEEEAIALANNTAYGLAASVYTSDLRRAQRVAASIKAGTVSVNGYSEGDISAPFGGHKQSGFGGRDNGLEAFDQYTQIKTVWYVN
ncbi:aldehyde dehydrogenase family protein [Arthrobacter polaris]|uniref:aldehyde dehydrogenase family protein n=1 Tax=Arthrobacter polaris TaxID=2813727 RepID=UPI002246C1B7|nr:aldehyde dehydrogenase family protein [Arthrobacter polaris]UIK90313.1 aldehyde dehydrogenase family protein [Arthrobacter polaris]